MVRCIVAAISLAFVVVSCGGGELTLSEYVKEVEGLTTDAYRTIDELTATLETASEADRYVEAINRLVAALQRLRDGYEALEPPEEVADLHAVSLDIMTRYTAAEEAFARRVAEVETAEEWDLVYETPEALAVSAVHEEMMAFCQARQAEVDASADREVFADAPWIPSDLQEVMTAFFGCRTGEDGGS